MFDTVEDDHWFWDTEALLQAQRMGYRVKEFPVDWTEKDDTKVDFSRDILDMSVGIARLWWKCSIEPQIAQRTTVVRCAMNKYSLFVIIPDNSIYQLQKGI